MIRRARRWRHFSSGELASIAIGLAAASPASGPGGRRLMEEVRDELGRRVAPLPERPFDAGAITGGRRW